MGLRKKNHIKTSLLQLVGEQEHFVRESRSDPRLHSSSQAWMQ